MRPESGQCQTLRDAGRPEGWLAASTLGAGPPDASDGEELLGEGLLGALTIACWRARSL